MGLIDRQLKIPAEVSRLDEVLSFLDDALEECGCPLKTIMQICLSVEELFVNVASYAYGEKTGDCVIELKLSADKEEGKGEAVVCITDWGREYNPLLRRDPDITLSADERQIGGLGILMVKKNMDAVEYQYEDSSNKIWLSKTWQQ